MRLFVIAILLVLFSFISFGQPPKSFNYQSVVRGDNGKILVDTSAYIQFSIIDSTINGNTIIYKEHHKTKTNQFGLINVHIGRGISPDDFQSINWGSGIKLLKVEIDLVNAGTTYKDLGTSQLLSVPYALYAGNLNTDSDSQTLSISGNTLSISNGNSISLPSGTIDTDDQNISLSGTTLSIDDGNSVDLSILQDGVNDADNNPTNEFQNLSISGNTLSIDNGNSVNIPSNSSIVPTVNVYTSNTTWTKPAGLLYVVVEVVGGGGAGGGSGSGLAYGTSGCGGGGGGYAKLIIPETSLGNTESITIGSGGIGSPGSAGTDGGTSSFGSHVSASGGEGGDEVVGSGGKGGLGVNGDINITGQDGASYTNSSNSQLGGKVGGSSHLGGGGRNNSGAAGSDWWTIWRWRWKWTNYSRRSIYSWGEWSPRSSNCNRILLNFGTDILI